MDARDGQRARFPRRAAGVLVGLATWLVVAAASSPSPAGGARPFEHRLHVSTVWPGDGGKNEVARDCRGCHDYTADPEKARKPVDTCVACHAEGSLAPDASAARVDPAREAHGAFPHRAHLKDQDGHDIACARCHAAPGALAGTRERSDVPPIVVPEAGGAGYCATCHDPAAPGASKAQRTAFDRGLTAMSAARAQREPAVERHFRHSDHVLPKDRDTASRAVCETCHAPIARADATHLGERQFALESCSKCHAGVTFATEPRQVPSETKATFVHAYHLGGRHDVPDAELAGDARGRIDQQGCLACHEYSKDGETYRVKSFLSGERAQQGCTTCHVAWKVEHHGETAVCRECHAIGAGSLTQFASMVQNRPRVDVVRADPATFRITEQAHPFVHADGHAVDGACSGCHVASFDRAPSRIGEKAFSHRAHLGSDFCGTPAAKTHVEQCTQCHSSISTAVAIGEITGTRFEGQPPGAPEARFVFDRAACDRCHGAPAFAPRVKTPIEPVSRLRFDHHAHLGRPNPLDKGQSLVCVDCHRTESRGDECAIVLDEKVQGCQLCHGHRDHADTTSGLTLASVAACVKCHAAGVPGKSEPVPVERLAIASRTSGSQEHSGDAACATCHLQWTERAIAHARPEQASRITGTFREGNPTPHGAVTNDKRTFRYYQDVAACIDCHWGNMTKPAQARNDQFLKQKDSAVERVHTAGGMFNESNFRKEFGARLDHFPGLAR